MLLKVPYLLFVIILRFPNSGSVQYKKSTVLISVLVRNKQHTLPYFLSNLERINYPKDRISLWIRSDHNSDESIKILNIWINSVTNQYHSIYTEFEDDDKTYMGELGVAHWTDDRFEHLMNVRTEALNFARKIWADYIWSVDADVFIQNPDTLNYLISKNVTIVAPMLQSEGLYSNFWFGMTEDYYYMRTKEYQPIVQRKNISCYSVPMVHSCVLIDLRKDESDYLTYKSSEIENYNGPEDDIIVFALSAMKNGVAMYICNEHLFGYITVPLEENDDIDMDIEHLLNIKIEALNQDSALYVKDDLETFVKQPKKDKLFFDKILMINLKRRPDRRERMEKCFDELGLEVEVFEAVDGKLLNQTFLETLTFMPEFKDPYHKRSMKLGEIGCFLSHYNIWNQIVANNYEITFVLEDDIRFESFFISRLIKVMEEVLKFPNWDLVYLGRKRLQDKDEPWVKGTQFLVEPSYSYWTIGYVLSLNGAKKLIDAKPLTKLVPVDEYLPILFNKHPRDNWKNYYPERNLIAFSAAPLLIYPTHYTGEEGYISDTEDSIIISDNIIYKDDL
ncbi:hypothetical protein ABEB36_000479 [Hypothenemus hampei]|uniref:Glycosyl transferase family 25 domain-containing protein n=1 Tax=Hypothenemus hampei TaxID=57062 RepID=A0ABD1FBD4_HYPHA